MLPDLRSFVVRLLGPLISQQGLPSPTREATATSYRRSLLLAFDLLRPPEGQGLNYSLFAFNGKPEWEEAWCDEIMITGAWVGSKRMHRLKSELPSFFETPLRAAYSKRYMIGESYLARVSFLELAEGDVHRLAHEQGGAREDLLRLVDFFLPPDPKHRVWPETWERAYILLLVPDSWSTQSEEVDSRVKSLWDELNLTDMASMPEVFLDLLVLPGQVLGCAESLQVVWMDPYLEVRKGANLVLPKTLLDLVSYILAPQVVQNLKHRLEQLPGGPAEVSKWLRLNGTKLLERYLRQHFADRSTILNEVLACTQDYRALEAQMRSNVIAQTEDSPRQPSWPELVTNPHRYRISKNLLWKRYAAEEEYEYVRNRVEKWESLVTEYLRDLLNGQVAASNLSLQKSVHRLTILAIIVGVLAAVISLIPDTVRSNLWNSLWQLMSFPPEVPSK